MSGLKQNPLAMHALCLTLLFVDINAWWSRINFYGLRKGKLPQCVLTFVCAAQQLQFNCENELPWPRQDPVPRLGTEP